MIIHNFESGSVEEDWMLKDKQWLSGNGQIKLAIAEGVSLKCSDPKGGSFGKAKIDVLFFFQSLSRGLVTSEYFFLTTCIYITAFVQLFS